MVCLLNGEFRLGSILIGARDSPFVQVSSLMLKVGELRDGFQIFLDTIELLAHAERPRIMITIHTFTYGQDKVFKPKALCHFHDSKFVPSLWNSPSSLPPALSSTQFALLVPSHPYRRQLSSNPALGGPSVCALVYSIGTPPSLPFSAFDPP